MTVGWLHVQWSTYGVWLPGDPRGFRNRDHRIHSSGTYKSPPPKGEHIGLLWYATSRLKANPVTLSIELRERARDAIVEKTAMMQMPLAALAVCGQHVHALVSRDDEMVDAEVGKLKRHSSHSLRESIPGTVWAAKCHPTHVESVECWRNTYRYILQHEAEGAAVWRRPTEQDRWWTEHEKRP